MQPPIDQLAALRRHQDVFLAGIGQADPVTPVPWCGRWKVTDLVVHLARIHHWAAAQARRQPEVPLGRGPFDLAELYARCAAELRDTLAELDPDARAWTLLDDGKPRAEQTGTVRFWHRRQALETLVHAWDLRTATGRGYDPGPEDWIDCLDEVVTVMHPRQLRLGRIAPPDARVRFRPAETERVWELTGAAPQSPTVTVSGPALTLGLLAWGRTTASDPSLAVTGDPAHLAGVLASGLTP
ncbi:MAG: maleylpyruvate isomerase family mycothiol-dependent enzyme [Propionicimonas sp.]|nr:maleylpyruvate isomerase family mycothiol-dependent enzyme [Propionicimonas sp.]